MSSSRKVKRFDKGWEPHEVLPWKNIIDSFLYKYGTMDSEKLFEICCGGKDMADIVKNNSMFRKTLALTCGDIICARARGKSLCKPIEAISALNEIVYGKEDTFMKMYNALKALKNTCSGDE